MIRGVELDGYSQTKQNIGKKMSNDNFLPESSSVSIGEFCRLFDSVTTSYKFLFFKGILEQLKANNFSNRVLSLELVMADMLLHAWYPCVFFKIFLGKQDQIDTVISSLNLPRQSTLNVARLRSHIQKEISENKIPNLLRHVPYRLLTCFYLNELRGISDASRNIAIYKKSIETFEQKKPLYKFLTKSEIEIHPEWAKYLRENISIVEGWHSWNWLTYLQKLNLNVPNLVEKLSPPIQRSSLKPQTDYWKAVISSTDLRCIYSGQKLTLDNFELDHYLPWSFVAHDNIWNLIPVLADANRSKSDFLPSAKYFNKFVELQHVGLIHKNQNLSKASWSKLTETFVLDLHIDKSSLIDFDCLKKVYSDALLPLICLAKSMGFKSEWCYKIKKD